MTQRLTTRFTLAGAIALALAGQAQAAGFALIEQSASGMGNAFAGAAAIAEDASTIYFNPAGMMKLPAGNQIVVGGHIIRAKAKFTDNGSSDWTSATPGMLAGPDDDGGTIGFVPNFYWATQLEPGVRFGIGVNAPFGLETKYDEDWIGRYHAVRSDLKTLNINPSVAFSITPKVDFGAGINIQYIEATLTNKVNYTVICSSGTVTCTGGALQPDGLAEVSGNGISYGWNLGLMINMSEATRIGLSYRSAIEHTVEGSVNFGAPTSITAAAPSPPVPLFVDGDARASVTLPETASASLVHQLNDKWTLLADWTWTRWSRFKELTFEYPGGFTPASTTVEEWKNNNRLSVAANYRLSPSWLLRAGAAYDRTPIPDEQHRTARIPGNDRKWLAFGFNWKASKTLAVDVGYAHLFVDKTPIENTESSPDGATLKGEYDSAVDILSAQLVWDF
ncbi:MAG TPA: hypothetical protein ENK62_08080 [Chromatiales bacterium]|nr:hypothetical protein [Chromatiales bacterium]